MLTTRAEHMRWFGMMGIFSTKSLEDARRFIEGFAE